MSNINDTIPTSGSPAISSDVRSNFVAAKAEIETLQSGGYAHDNGQYLATDEIKARDSDGVKLNDADGNGIFVKHGGNVGMGIASPLEKLVVAGAVTSDRSGTFGKAKIAGGGSDNSGLLITYAMDGTTIQNLVGGGFVYFLVHLVGIGTATPTLTSNGRLDMNADIMRLRTAYTPGSAGHTGNQGEICWDTSYMYVCVATNSWHRTEHSTW